MRIEPSAASFPTMTGMAVTAGNSDIGTVIGHHGVWGLVLTDLAAWRSALQAGHALRCADQTVLITWPTWLAVDSNGRSGPAGKIRR